MKIIILKNNLKEGLSVVDRIASKSLSLPILNNVLLSTEDNFLKLSVTDLEIGINYWILTKTEQKGKIATPAKFLSSFISSISDEKIILKTKENILYVGGENNETKINSFDSEEFPIIPKIEKKEYIEIESSTFCQGLSQVVENASSSQTRPEISGVYISFGKDLMTIVATDSFRLAEKKIFFKKTNNNKCSLIIPQKTIREIVNILSEKEGVVRIYLSPNQIMFEYLIKDFSRPKFQIISRLIEGEFPAYQEIIPKKSETKLILFRNEFINKIKTASLFSGKTNEIKLKIDPKKKRMELSAQDAELGENRSSVNCKIEGDETDVSFNWKFLMDGLTNIKSEEIIFELKKEGGPATIKPVGDTNFLYVVMPIKAD